jgi:hypothetical protein
LFELFINQESITWFFGKNLKMSFEEEISAADQITSAAGEHC